MHALRNPVSVIGLLAILTVASQARAGEYPPGTWDNIIDGQTFTNGLSLFGASKNNTLIINSTFNNSDNPNAYGVYMGNVNNVYIKDSEFYGVRNPLGMEPSTSNVTFDNNYVHDVPGHAIWVFESGGSKHANLRITNNIIERTGQNCTWSEHIHALYIMSNDFEIAQNIISDSDCGMGISVRGTGTISGNRISGSQKHSIGYWADHPADNSMPLLVENNVVVENDLTQDGLISFFSGGGSTVAANIIARFNTCVGEGANGRTCIRVSDLSSSNVQVYGNFAVSLSSNPQFYSGSIDYNSSNSAARDMTGFADGSNFPYDLHLTSDSPAHGYSTGEANFPKFDRDGVRRPGSDGSLDSGAYQLVTTTQTLSAPTNVSVVK